MIPATKPATPKLAIANVGGWIPICIFNEIKMIKAILNMAAHFPEVVFGHNLIFILLTSYLASNNDIKLLVDFWCGRNDFSMLSHLLWIFFPFCKYLPTNYVRFPESPNYLRFPTGSDTDPVLIIYPPTIKTL